MAHLGDAIIPEAHHTDRSCNLPRTSPCSLLRSLAPSTTDDVVDQSDGRGGIFPLLDICWKIRELARFEA